MKVLFGTGNLAKIAVMKRRLESLGIEVIGLHELGMPVPEVIEDGQTPLENAHKKAVAYHKAFHMPVFSCDSGLYFDNVPDAVQPGVHVRTVNGRYLTDEEMRAHYAALALRYGDLSARYKNAICFILEDGRIFEAMEPSMESERFIITSKPHSDIRSAGFPLDSLSVDIRTGRYLYDLPEQAQDRFAVEDGFLAFFKKVLGR